MRLAALLLAVSLVGCAAARTPAEEERGLPLRGGARSPAPRVDDLPDAPPAPPPLGREACAALRITTPSSAGGVLGREAMVRAIEAATPAVREAVCACPPREAVARIVVTTTPDRGSLSARSEGDAAIDRCLAARLDRVSLPRWHLGSDCVDCGPRRRSVPPGRAEDTPARGEATISFPIVVAR